MAVLFGLQMSSQLFGLFGCQEQHKPLGAISRDFRVMLILFYIPEALFFQHRTQVLSKYSFVMGHSLMKRDKHVGTYQKQDCDPICCSHPL